MKLQERPTNDERMWRAGHGSTEVVADGLERLSVFLVSGSIDYSDKYLSCQSSSVHSNSEQFE